MCGRGIGHHRLTVQKLPCLMEVFRLRRNSASEDCRVPADESRHSTMLAFSLPMLSIFKLSPLS